MLADRSAISIANSETGQGEGGEFSWRQSRCSTTVTANATAPLLDQHQVRRVAPTRRQRAAAASGPQKELRAVQQRRQARLAELGFATLEEYLQDRCVGRGWSVRRLGAELGVGHGWLDQQLQRLGLRT
jgi:hypothetical protein